MALLEGRVGSVQSNDGDQRGGVVDKYGNLSIVGGGGQYQEAAYRGRTFVAANQAATTTTVGLATTYTGLCLSNPAGNTKALVVLQVGVSVAGAPAALSQLGLMGGYVAAGVVTHTTPLVIQPAYLGLIAGAVPVPTGKADAAATLAPTPVVMQIFATQPITGATAQVVTPPTTGVYFDVAGAIVLGPGGHVAVYTSTVLSVIASITWMEIPL